MLYDIWDNIKHKLVENKTIQGYNETFVNDKNNSMTMKEAYALVENGTYDICIGYFSVVKSRINSQFTRPLYLNKYALAYIPDESDFTIIIKGIFNGFIKPVLYAIVIVVIMLFIIKIIPNKFLSKELRSSTTWELITTLIFKSTTQYKKEPNVSNTIILLMELFFGIYFISELTTTLTEVKYKLHNSKIDAKSIINERILTPKGYGNSIHWEKYGAIIEENTDNNILQVYEQNTTEYFGFFDDLEMLKAYQVDNNKLIISSANFGFDEIAWVMNSNSQLSDVLYNINNEIIILQDNNTLMNLCRTYFHEDKYLCEL